MIEFTSNRRSTHLGFIGIAIRPSGLRDLERFGRCAFDLIVVCVYTRRAGGSAAKRDILRFSGMERWMLNGTGGLSSAGAAAGFGIGCERFTGVVSGHAASPMTTRWRGASTGRGSW